MDSIRTILPDQYPELLRQIVDPPACLYIKGTMPPADCKILTVVGSRKYTEYGKEVCERLIASLAGLPVCIVSGLALGIDSIAHRAALRHSLHTIAVPGSGLADEVLYPPSHFGLAHEILDASGALLSPFPNTTAANIWTFPGRNRIMAGMSHATLVIEAGIKSGTLITAKHAVEFSRDVFTVPGSIFSKQSEGPHMLIRLGATPITSGDELRAALGFTVEEKPKTIKLSTEEKRLADLLIVPLSRQDLYAQAGAAGIGTAEASILLSMLEIKGAVAESEGLIRLL